MLATFVIGLREGLEAALIVGIIASFLRANGRRLTVMWVGVGLALAISIAAGVTLAAVEGSLPQAAQEGMETVIGAVAVVFVTGMIVWMNRHARGMKAELEQRAGAALRQGQTTALAVMAFLAVLKEGFETSVFLLATFTASGDAGLAALGATLGILAAVGIGVAIYLGGLRLNLSQFFRVTGAFLILVAAGLVISTLRSAHEAGWLVGGQQRTVDLTGLVAPGTVVSALATGVLGIPADPRLIEVVAWCAYLVPIVLYVYWPRRARVPERRVGTVQLAIAGTAAIVAVCLVVSFGLPRAAPTGPLAVQVGQADTDAGTVLLAGDALLLSLDGAVPRMIALDRATAVDDVHDGVAAQRFAWTADAAASAPTSLSLDELTALAGGRLPIGLDRSQQTGPFAVAWQIDATGEAWLAGGELLDASESERAVAQLIGGGLPTPRTVTLSGTDPTQPEAGWHVAADAVADALSAAADAQALADDRVLWGLQAPAVLLVASAVLVLARLRRRRSPASRSVPLDVPPPETPSPTA